MAGWENSVISDSWENRTAGFATLVSLTPVREVSRERAL